jgi:type IV pilus assembly protein PilV
MQRGFTLIEALVSMGILALGVLGLASIQGRMLVDTRTTNSRATAVRLIGELSERIRLNAQGAQPGVNTALPKLSPYSDATANTFLAPATPNPNPVAATCDPLATPPVSNCSPQDQAAYDVWFWRAEVAQSLMNGTASIWQISPRQLQVIVSWQANENTDTALPPPGSAAAVPAPAAGTAAQQVATPLQSSNGGTDGLPQCGIGPTLCHIDFIDIPSGQ